MKIYYIVTFFTAVLQLWYFYEYDDWNSSKNKSKSVPAEMYLRRLPTAFRTATIKNIQDGCFQSVREAAVCKIFAKYLRKQT